jgi:hypothetical protein
VPLDRISVPVLFVHNTNDGCKFTRLEDVRRVAEKLEAGGSPVDVIEVTSTKAKSDPCKALSPHGFLGIEASVVSKITQWIEKAN